MSDVVRLPTGSANRAMRLGEAIGRFLAEANRQAQIIGKGGHAERIFWDSEANRLLSRLVAGRRTGPVFLASKAPSPCRQPAAGDLDPDTGRAW